MSGAELLMTESEILADRDKWLARRRDGIGASEAAMLLDLAPSRIGGRFTLYHRKREGLETVDTPAMERGRYLEPYVSAKFRESRPDLTVYPGGLYRSMERPWMLATPDRIAELSPFGVDRVPVQLKTSIPEDEFGGESGNRLPAYHRAQALWEMAVTGADHAYVPVLFIRPWEVVTYTLARDAAAERDIRLLIEAGEDMMDRLESGREPDPDATVATTDTLRRLYPGIEDRAVQVPIELARRYRNAGRARTKADERRNLARNEILARLGTARLAWAIDHELGKPKDGYQVRVATRTASEREAYEVPASDGPNHRTNPCGWAKS